MCTPQKFIGLSFGRPYLIKDLNIMIAKSMKSADFDVDFVVFNVDFADFTDFGVILVNLTISFHSTVSIQG